MWLESLLDRLFSVIPRIAVMPPNRAGYRVTPKPWGGTWLTVMQPGNWYVLWPAFNEFETCAIKTQVADLKVQSVCTKDGVDMAISGAIRYHIHDASKALLNVYDYDKSLETLSLAVICKFVRQYTYEELKGKWDELQTNLLKAVRDESNGWGLRIETVTLTDIGRCRNIRLLMNSQTITG